MSLLFGLLLLILGAWTIISPKSVLDFKINIVKMFGAKLTVSKKTVDAIRWIGVIVFAFGILLVF